MKDEKNPDGSCLINANQAKTDIRKFTEYALNPDHSVGGDKARVFESALGYNQSNYYGLLHQIREGVMKNPAVAGKMNNFGVRYTVDIPVTGPQGECNCPNRMDLRPGSQIPELTTLFVR